MNNTEPIYSGRKIRFEYQDELKKDSVEEEEKIATETKPEEKVIITFGEACSKGWIKPGMAVVFKDCDTGEFYLDKELDGQGQLVECQLDKGIVVKNENGKLEIFAVMRSPTLELSGRYGRANSLKIVRSLFNEISKKIEESEFYQLSQDEFFQLCRDNDLLLQYCCYDRSDFDDITFAGLCGHYYNVNLRYGTMSSGSIKPGSFKHPFKKHPILIKGRKFVVFLKKGKETTINRMHSFEYNPYETYVEIRGITT